MKNILAILLLTFSLGAIAQDHVYVRDNAVDHNLFTIIGDSIDVKSYNFEDRLVEHVQKDEAGNVRWKTIEHDTESGVYTTEIKYNDILISKEIKFYDVNVEYRYYLLSDPNISIISNLQEKRVEIMYNDKGDILSEAIYGPQGLEYLFEYEYQYGTGNDWVTRDVTMTKYIE